ncbi:MAG: hypothetical protein ORN26_00400, partial [Candidatus Pacebacteria bacterium]|nr:hypothetical protein [Candidatus Paceibacterota bacterium]
MLILFVFYNIKRWTVSIYSNINTIISSQTLKDLQIENEKLRINIDSLRQINMLDYNKDILMLDYVMSDSHIYNKLLLKSSSTTGLMKGDIVFLIPNTPVGIIDSIDNNLIVVQLFSNKDFQSDALIYKDVNDKKDYTDIVIKGDGAYSAYFEINNNVSINIGDQVYIRHIDYPIGIITQQSSTDIDNNR